jgi:ABC-type uncharacterized transport system substrate-binding protein
VHVLARRNTFKFRATFVLTLVHCRAHLGVCVLNHPHVFARDELLAFDEAAKLFKKFRHAVGSYA